MAGLSVDVQKHRVHDDVTLLPLSGFLDSLTTPEFERVSRKVLDDRRHKMFRPAVRFFALAGQPAPPTPSN